MTNATPMSTKRARRLTTTRRTMPRLRLADFGPPVADWVLDFGFDVAIVPASGPQCLCYAVPLFVVGTLRVPFSHLRRSGTAQVRNVSALRASRFHVLISSPALRPGLFLV